MVALWVQISDNNLLRNCGSDFEHECKDIFNAISVISFGDLGHNHVRLKLYKSIFHHW